MNELPKIPDDLFARPQIVEGLRRMADFLDEHPEIPVPPYGWELGHYPDRTCDEEERADIDHVADILDHFGGKRIDESGAGGHDRAMITFGRITYQMVRVPIRRRELFAARASYEDNITLDDTGDAVA